MELLIAVLTLIGALVNLAAGILSFLSAASEFKRRKEQSR